MAQTPFLQEAWTDNPLPCNYGKGCLELLHCICCNFTTETFTMQKLEHKWLTAMLFASLFKCNQVIPRNSPKTWVHWALSNTYGNDNSKRVNCNNNNRTVTEFYCKKRITVPFNKIGSQWRHRLHTTGISIMACLNWGISSWPIFQGF